MIKYYDVNAAGHSIRCKAYCTDARSAEQAVLFGHGFGGHKDNKAAQRFAEAVLAKNKRTAVITFDWPCHGGDVKKRLTLADCTAYIDLLLSDIPARWQADRIAAHATSFGGYLFLKYILEHGNPFTKIALRCPAVNMYDSLTQRVMENGDWERLRRGKDAAIGFDRKITVDMAFLQSLKDFDLQTKDFIDYAEDILIVHGTKDEVIPFDVVRDFADSQLIEFLPIENADHRFKDPVLMDLAVKHTRLFLGL